MSSQRMKIEKGIRKMLTQWFATVRGLKADTKMAERGRGREDRETLPPRMYESGIVTSLGLRWVDRSEVPMSHNDLSAGARRKHVC